MEDFGAMGRREVAEQPFVTSIQWRFRAYPDRQDQGYAFFGGVRAPAAARSPCRHVDQNEAFPPRCVGETLVERDDLKRCGTTFGSDEGSCKL